MNLERKNKWVTLLENTSNLTILIRKFSKIFMLKIFFSKRKLLEAKVLKSKNPNILFDNNNSINYYFKK